MYKKINTADVHTYSHAKSGGIRIQRICKSVLLLEHKSLSSMAVIYQFTAVS